MEAVEEEGKEFLKTVKKIERQREKGEPGREREKGGEEREG